MPSRGLGLMSLVVVRWRLAMLGGGGAGYIDIPRGTHCVREWIRRTIGLGLVGLGAIREVQKMLALLGPEKW